MNNQEPGVFGRLPITAGPIALGLVVIFSVAYGLVPPRMRDVIIFAAAAATAAGTVVSSYYSSAAIQQVSRLHHQAAEVARLAADRAQRAEEAASNRAKVAVSLRIMERFNDPTFSRTLRKWREQRRKILADTPDETWRRLEADVAARATVQETLNRLEEIAIAVLSDAADEKTLLDAIKPILDDVFLACKPSIIDKNRQLHPLAWIQIEGLHRRWLR